jgi:hypothetical protein
MSLVTIIPGRPLSVSNLEETGRFIGYLAVCCNENTCLACIRVDGLNLVPGYFSLYGVEHELISVSSNVFALVAEDRNRRYMIYS